MQFCSHIRSLRFSALNEHAAERLLAIVSVRRRLARCWTFFCILRRRRSSELQLNQLTLQFGLFCCLEISRLSDDRTQWYGYLIWVWAIPGEVCVFDWFLCLPLGIFHRPKTINSPLHSLKSHYRSVDATKLKLICISIWQSNAFDIESRHNRLCDCTASCMNDEPSNNARTHTRTGAECRTTAKNKWKRLKF